MPSQLLRIQSAVQLGYQLSLAAKLSVRRGTGCSTPSYSISSLDLTVVFGSPNNNAEMSEVPLAGHVAAANSEAKVRL